VPGFYEFFAGGGMARLGLGAGWECLFANDTGLLIGVKLRQQKLTFETGHLTRGICFSFAL
jgi:hypothetical protein